MATNIQQSPDEESGLTAPVMGKKAPMKMKTPGMGTMLGSPRYKAQPAMGKIEPGASPYGEPTKMKKGGSVGSASKRADGCCSQGKTKGKFV